MTWLKRLDAGSVRWLRIVWCDHAGLIRAKAAHRRLLDKGLPDGIGITVAQQALPVMFDAVAPDSGLGPIGEARLVPDWSTLAVLPWAPGHAQVMGDMRVAGAPWEHCPREYLRGQVRALADAGFTARAAFENEFFLLRRAGDRLLPADDTVYAATGGMNLHHAFVTELTATLEALAMPPEFYYPESAPGQQEISIGHAAPLDAADRQVTYREAVRGVAVRHGYVASFLPKIHESAAGSGCHLNFSLWGPGKRTGGKRGAGENVMSDPRHATGLSEVARRFIAGVLAHLPGLAALTVPSRNSYRRLLPHFWAGAFVVWGGDNREAAIRVTRAPGGAARFELKTCDATCNPYLALGALIAAGLDGVRRGLDLPAEVTVDPGYWSDDERRRRGIAPLPRSLGEALDALAADKTLVESLGSARARAYMAVKRMEWEALRDLSLADEVALLAERY
ncbi:MAG TPA: glutamine synthetase family protein [Methylomirabilota bacterium]|jgi:glutamine synthetase|nr:glutamine synthetase family protein [Methylomirabilota bacterium]